MSTETRTGVPSSRASPLSFRLSVSTARSRLARSRSLSSTTSASRPSVIRPAARSRSWSIGMSFSSGMAMVSRASAWPPRTLRSSGRFSNSLSRGWRSSASTSTIGPATWLTSSR